MPNACGASLESEIHERGASGAYVFVACIVKLVAEGHLDHRGNRVYWTEQSSVWPFKSWSQTLLKSVFQSQNMTTHMLINMPYSFSCNAFLFETVLNLCTNTYALHKILSPNSSPKHIHRCRWTIVTWLTEVWVFIAWYYYRCLFV